MGLPLEGVRVVELGAWMAAPACCAVLADWGAEVIKLEHPERGDPARGIRSIGVTPVADFNYIWEMDNRNKKSLGVNLKHEMGRGVAHRLIGASDAFVTNFQESELRRLGLDYETLAGLNPRLIYAQISGYGEKGPEGDKPGYDLGAWARSGFMLTTGEPDALPPISPVGNIDRYTGMFAAGGVALALYTREKTGTGQKVSLSLLGSALWTGGINVQASLATGRDIPKTSRKTAGNPLYNSYRTQDGRWLVLLMLQTDLYWEEFCRALGREELIHDPRFDTHAGRTARNNIELIEILDEVFASAPLEEWQRRFSGRNLIWEAARSYAEVAGDPQAEANEYFQRLDHPNFGEIRLVASPVKLSRTPPRLRSPAPQLGEHTEEVLLQLGYSWEEISRLKEAGAII